MGNSTLTIIAHSEITALESSEKKFPIDWERFSVGKMLSNHLITQEETRYSLIIPKWLEDTLREKAPGPIICSDIDILFQPAMGLDPLFIFRQISRFTSLIVLWPGSFKDGVLSYAVPEHKHYRFWKEVRDIEIKGVSDAL